LGYGFQGDDYEVILLINPSSRVQLISIPEGDWTVLADHEYAGISSNRVLHGREAKIEPVSLNVLLKK
jgi:pullulanase